MLDSDSRKALEETIRRTRGTLPETLKKHTQSRLRLSLSLDKSGLEEPERTVRERFEQWRDERVRALKALDPKADDKALGERALDLAVHECAATLVNRLVILRAMEARKLTKVPVLTGAKSSSGYAQFREFAPALCDVTEDESEGYGTLLGLVFKELAASLPGVFGDVGVTELVQVPAGALLSVVEALDDEALRRAWDDDTTPGWVYQYWNDPAREALDAKVNDGQKIAPHEIASKTQMFTERYMVEWLLQNTLGLQWLALCEKHGWTADARSVLPSLEARRAEWRSKRDAGEVPLDALMPVQDGLERRWCYWVEQPVPRAMVEATPDSVRQWKVLDPACGSGHFLVIAFGLLFALYQEEARHRGERWSEREITRWIIEDNLYGVDLDPRAVQLAAASLWLAAREACVPSTAATADRTLFRRMNLVATSFDLARLPAKDPSLVALEAALAEDCGLDPKTTETILQRLKGLDAWGSLVRIHEDLDALLAVDRAGFVAGDRGQLSLGDTVSEAERARAKKITANDRVVRTRAEVEAKLEAFLAMHTSHADLGVRVGGQQLAAGVRFASMMRDGTFDIVVGNPPYQTTAKLTHGAEIAERYPDAKTDLFAMFYLRGLELAKPHGCVGLVTLSNWMFLGSFEPLRKAMLAQQPRLIADFGKAAFSTGGTLISTSATIVEKTAHERPCIVIRPYPPSEIVRDDGQPPRTWAALLCQRARFEFDPSAFRVIDGEPIVYWWSKELLERYASVPKLGEVALIRVGLQTSDNTRFVRRPFEVETGRLLTNARADRGVDAPWVPFVMGAAGKRWVEPLDDSLLWKGHGLEIKLMAEFRYRSYSRTVKNESTYFQPGVAFAAIGSAFSARIHRFPSVTDVVGSSVYLSNRTTALTSMNRGDSRAILESLNPTIHFQTGDVARLPLFPVESSDTIYARLDEAFTQHERAREASVEFVAPERSCWAYAQAWAQRAVDRAPGEPLPEYAPSESDWLPPDSASEPVKNADEHGKRAAFDHVSYAIGVAMGRFGANGEGVLASASDTALPSGILFVSATGDRDSLDPSVTAVAPIRAAWEEFGDRVGDGDDLRTWLRKGFFPLHNARYEKRPIYLPLSSEKRSFVAWVSIHRWTHNTLTVLVADHLEPLRRAMRKQIDELRAARESAKDKKARAESERRVTELTKQCDELEAFVTKVREVNDRGAPPAGEKCPARERDDRFVMDLDDGVMVNSAALWPLLDPQWKDPKKWWVELSKADGRKDYDWSKMAGRYWPTRVRAKCEEDPSLAVAHGCFWELHPEKAWRWEQRLKGELGDDWVIDEAGATARRDAWVKANAQRAEEILEEERRRREQRTKNSAERTEDAAGEGEEGTLFDG
jgi:hypothetical protein